MDWCDPEGKPVELSEVGWFADAIDETHPVGEKLSNPWGLHDMAGNVGEWTGDWYASRHASSRSPSPTSGASGGERVHRGGSFGSAVSGCRFANRDKLTPDSRFANLGFRVVLSAASADGGH